MNWFKYVPETAHITVGEPLKVSRSCVSKENRPNVGILNIFSKKSRMNENISRAEKTTSLLL